jgi:hypothetical protein
LTGPDIVRRRDAIGLSLDDFAFRLHEHPEQVRAWEGIRSPIPRSLARRLDWVLALAEREAAIRAAGIPPCPVVQELTSTPMPKRTPETLSALAAKLHTHAATCPVCQQRQAVWDAQPPLPPPPLPPFMALLASIHAHAEGLPSYLRPAIWGALGFGALTLFRAAILLGATRGAGLPQAAMAVGLGVAIGAYGGAAWGLAYHFARPAFTRYGRTGDYLTGVAVAAAIGVAVSAPLAAFKVDPLFRKPVWWVILAIAALVIGLVLGHRVFRTRTTPDGV